MQIVGKWWAVATLGVGAVLALATEGVAGEATEATFVAAPPIFLDDQTDAPTGDLLTQVTPAPEVPAKAERLARSEIAGRTPEESAESPPTKARNAETPSTEKQASESSPTNSQDQNNSAGPFRLTGQQSLGGGSQHVRRFHLQHGRSPDVQH